METEYGVFMLICISGIFFSSKEERNADTCTTWVTLKVSFILSEASQP
jgi:hypothetical protein